MFEVSPAYRKQGAPYPHLDRIAERRAADVLDDRAAHEAEAFEESTQNIVTSQSKDHGSIARLE